MQHAHSRSHVDRRDHARATPLKLDMDKVDRLVHGILDGKRVALSRAITLVESSRAEHRREAEVLISRLLDEQHKAPTAGENVGGNELSEQQQQQLVQLQLRQPEDGEEDKEEGSRPERGFQHGMTLRLGVAGPPGAGKSTFIESLGCSLVDQGYKVAVVAVDPSSLRSGGSILGDKTRMERLSACQNAYVRASPTRGVLGGIAEHTNDVVLLLEGAGFDVIIVESVGVGQSEVTINEAVDALLLLVPPGGGDDLQGVKKGIMEVADIVIVNKADGDLRTAANHTKADYTHAVKFIRPKYRNWRVPVLLMSAVTEEGVAGVVDTVKDYHTNVLESGDLQEKRMHQASHWMWQQLEDKLKRAVETAPRVLWTANAIQEDLLHGRITPARAADRLLDAFMEGTSKTDVSHDHDGHHQRGHDRHPDHHHHNNHHHHHHHHQHRPKHPVEYTNDLRQNHSGNAPPPEPPTA